MLNKLKNPNEYTLNGYIVEFAEDIQKLRKAKSMLQKNVPQEKVCQYTTLEPEEVQILDDLFIRFHQV